MGVMRSMIKLLALCALVWPTLASAQQGVVPFERQVEQNNAFYDRLSTAEKMLIGVFTQKMQSVVSGQIAEEAAASQEMAKLKLFELLAPQFRRQDMDGAITRDRLARARETVDRFADLKVQHDAGRLALIDQSDLPPKLKAHYHAVSVTMIAELQPKRLRIHEVTFQLLDAVEQCAGRLSAAKWEIQNGQYAFASAKDLEAFSADLRRIDALSREESRLMAELQQRVAPTF